MTENLQRLRGFRLLDDDIDTSKNCGIRRTST